MNISHILVTTDLSPESLRPCRPVASLAKELGARITLLHVVQDLKIAPHGAPLAPAISAPDLHDELQHAALALEEQQASLGTDAEVSSEAISGGSIAESVAEYADGNGVDLIAMSTHGRTGFRHLALGSVAEAVLRHAHVPVLTFPQAK
ncbi:MAG: universal stress protein [Planctomycetota bacterium]|jgi:nucleotide-binding universal stress UspA family protein|nr:universal stress protein [Planctomycetota bacterium]MDP6368636.1 universal stress protein [Planctomycetota bacterium]MDP6519746.1 universal stress protein [Planctomycetota bacterium]MDP6837328.1 universal stress protein [Planctomycetota bacterium]MDP6956931.1 universal stress protein [Planctomycetota bacterium]